MVDSTGLETGRLPQWELVVLIASLMALNAAAIDIFIPALQDIGAALGVATENQRQFVITSYVAGFGAAQLIYGPLSDRFGRRPVLFFGLGLYVAAALAAAFAPTFGVLLALRAIQGIGAAATRVIAISVVRDCFGGRRMASVMSLVMMVFMAIPVIAPEHRAADHAVRNLEGDIPRRSPVQLRRADLVGLAPARDVASRGPASADR